VKLFSTFLGCCDLWPFAVLLLTHYNYLSNIMNSFKNRDLLYLISRRKQTDCTEHGNVLHSHTYKTTKQKSDIFKYLLEIHKKILKILVTRTSTRRINTSCKSHSFLMMYRLHISSQEKKYLRTDIYIIHHIIQCTFNFKYNSGPYNNFRVA